MPRWPENYVSKRKCPKCGNKKDFYSKHCSACAEPPKREHIVFTEETRRKMSESAKLRCTPEWRKAKSQAYSTKLPVEEIAALYQSGMTQDEISVHFGVTQKVLWKFMRNNGIQARKAAKREQRREKNDSWKGDAAGYAALHRRLDSLYGKPKKCEVCSTTDPGRTYDWANLTGHYEDISDFKRMCRSCHSTYDKKINNITKKGGQS